MAGRKAFTRLGVVPVACPLLEPPVTSILWVGDEASDPVGKGVLFSMEGGPAGWKEAWGSAWQLPLTVAQPFWISLSPVAFSL